jgi:hypothetical protein
MKERVFNVERICPNSSSRSLRRNRTLAAAPSLPTSVPAPASLPLLTPGKPTLSRDLNELHPKIRKLVNRGIDADPNELLYRLKSLELQQKKMIKSARTKDLSVLSSLFPKLAPLVNREVE